MSIVDPDIAGAGTAEDGQGDAGLEAAFCPHCSAPVGDGVFPWPPDPTRCPACGQWIGRNRAAAEPVDASAAPEEGNGAPRRRTPRAMSVLLGRRSDGDESPAPAEGDVPADEELWASDSVEVEDRPAPEDGAPVAEGDAVDELLHEEAPTAIEEPPAADEREEPPPAADGPAAAAARAIRRRRSGGFAARVRGLGERVKSELSPSAKQAAPEAPEARDEVEPPAEAPEEPPQALEDELPPAVDAEPTVAEAIEDEAEVELELEPEPEPEAEADDEPEPVAEALEEDLDEEPVAEPEPEPEPEPVAEVAEEEPEPELVEEEEEPEPELVEEEEEPEPEPVAEAIEEEEPEPEPAALAEDEPEADEPDAPPADDGELDLRTVAARVAVSRMLSGAEAKTSRLPALPIPQKLQAPRIARPKPRPAAARRPAPQPGPITAGAKRKRQPVRITGISMVVLGLLILAYGTVTLVWQDPWTAWQAARAQDRANVEFNKIVKDFRKSAKTQQKVATRDWLHRQAALFNLNTPEGQPVGKLSIPKIGIHFTIVQGTEETTLQKGPAHYVETPLPGAKGKWTVGIAGHRTTYLAPFRHIDQLDPGDKITIQMPYAKFFYTVEKTRIVDATNQRVLAADSAITGRKPYNRLALTACHPPFSAAQRIIVYSRLMHYRVSKAQS